jgi:kynurenine 3-monooxygenase
MAQVLIVGAGLGGTLMACLLARAGHEVDLFERRPDPRLSGYVGGRSINLALSARGIHGLTTAGLAADVLRDVIPMRGRMIHSTAGELAFQPYSANPSDAINSISRGGLNINLLEAAAKYPNLRQHFNQRCVDVDLSAPAATFVDEISGASRTVSAEIIVGADGAFSAVRGKMQITDRYDYSQSYLQHGYKELTIPPAAGGAFAMEPNALHIWPRGGFMMIALPNQDRSFTCTLFWPFRGPRSFEAVSRAEDVLPFFQSQFPDAVPLMPTLVEDYMRNPIGTLVTVRCAPWHMGGKVVLLGDAAHAIVPFYGQGMNAAFEDCVALEQCMREHEPDFSRAFEAYAAMRKPNTDAIADMAMDNFIEMRDHVASPMFLLRKKTEQMLQRVFPAWFMPLYNMISFSLIPYAEARRRARRQNRIVAGVIAGFALALLLAAIAIALRWR